MQNLELEAEAVQVSIYANIIPNVLKKHKVLSVSKMTFFAYAIKKEKYRLGKIYAANNTQDVVSKAISLLAGEYIEYCENIEFVLKAMHLLMECKWIKMEGVLLYLEDGIDVEKSIYEESPFIEKAIEMSKSMSDRQFMKEVIANV